MLWYLSVCILKSRIYSDLNYQPNSFFAQSLSASIMSSFNTEAIKLGAIGVTVCVSSGDNGVANYGCTSCDPTKAVTYNNCACNANSGSSTSSWTGTNTWSGEGYFPNFPASNPYVTAVGATMGADGFVPVGESEIACQSQLGGNVLFFENI